MRFAIRITALSAALVALAACSDATEDIGEVAGEPVAAVEPPAGQSWLDMTQVTPEGGVLHGNPDAPIKLVEYASHTCHVCADFSREGVPELEEKYISTGRVSLELRNLVRDPIDLTFATLARCGDESNLIARAGQGWNAFDQVMATAQANGPALEQAIQAPESQRFIAIGQAAGLIDFFAARGLSEDQARSCLADTANITRIAERSQAQATDLNIQGTPTFFLNGERLDVTQWAALEPVLRGAGAR